MNNQEKNTGRTAKDNSSTQDCKLGGICGIIEGFWPGLGAWIKEHASFLQGALCVIVGLYLLLKTFSVALNVAFFMVGALCILYGLFLLDAHIFDQVFQKIGILNKR